MFKNFEQAYTFPSLASFTGVDFGEQGKKDE
jgi:hypothetical protein